MKVLILEDDEQISDLLVEEIAEAGHTILGPAGTVGEAFAVIAGGDMPDLALVDIKLRHGSRGTEFAKEVAHRFNLPCIFVSSDVSDAIQHRHVALGYISKPFRPATIVDSLETAQSIIDGRVPEHIPEGLELFQ